MTLQQAQLIKRTAYQLATQKREATEEENQQYLPYAVQVLMYTAACHSALWDMVGELEDAKLFKHYTKRYVQMAINKVGYVHNALYKVMGSHSDYFGEWYNYHLERADNSIAECVLLSAPERAYNVVRAFMRMAIYANNKCGRFKCPAVANIEEASRFLDNCKLPIEDHRIDNILARAIDTKDLTKKMRTDELHE